MRPSWIAFGFVASLALASPARADSTTELETHHDTFDPDVALPQTGTAIAGARDAMRRSSWREARTLVEEARRARPDDAELGYLLGRIAAIQGDLTTAAHAFGEVAHMPSPLAEWAAVGEAEALETYHASEALSIVAPLLTADAPAIVHRARAIEARALVHAGRVNEGVEKLRALIAEQHARANVSQLAWPLANALESRDDEASREEAIRLYQRIASRAPTSTLGRDAHARAERLLARLTNAKRHALAEASVNDELAAADIAFDAMRHDEAERAYVHVEARLADDPQLRCEVQLKRAQTMLRRRARREATAFLERISNECESDDIRAWAHFLAGKTYVLLGERDNALRAFDSVVDVAPTHRLADDALFRGALVARDLGDQEGMRRRLETVYRDHPDGDMKAEAFFALGWSERVDHPEAALATFNLALATRALDTTEDTIGRIEYWRARTLHQLDRHDDAVAAYESIAAHLPLTYYATLAVTRLRELDPARATLAEAAMRDAGRDAPLRFSWQPAMRSAGFERAIALVRLGELDQAREEFGALGALTDGAPTELTPVVAALLEAVGQNVEATQLARRSLVQALRLQSATVARAIYRIAYPSAFAPEIEDAAKEAGISPALLRAIAREESGFDPRVESPAHAHGLVQLIEPTARRFGEPLGVHVSVTTLHDARTNLRIGGAFLAFLADRYAGRMNAIPAAYNAGESAADRWLRDRAHVGFDEWVEQIPYEESRRYTRRVLQTWSVYAALEGDAGPQLAWIDPAEARARAHAAPENQTAPAGTETASPEVAQAEVARQPLINARLSRELPKAH